MMNVKRPAVIDIGSNSVRLVIYEDFSPATSIFYNEKFSCKLGLLTKDGYLMDKAKLKTLQALERFTKICQANNVISIKAIATAAMRDALDGHDFVKKAINNGASTVLINGKKLNRFNDVKVPIITVEDTKLALGDIARVWRK